MINIENIYQQGDDALGNCAEMTVVPFDLFPAFSEPLKFRTTNIDIPEFSIGTYEVNSKSQKFEKPNGRDDTSKTFTSTFRVDKYYTVYKALLAWTEYIRNSDTGTIAEDVGAITKVSNIRTDILVQTIDSSGILTNSGFTFQRAFPKSIAGFSYDISTGEPLTCQVTWSFVKMIPQIV